MFEQFGEMLYMSFAYRMEEIEKGKLYLVRHTNADRRERWTKVEFEVRVIGENDEFDCECGQFAHMGMLCGHALKVKSLNHMKISGVLFLFIVRRRLVASSSLLGEIHIGMFTYCGVHRLTHLVMPPKITFD
jgi:hypothetical protein